MSSFDDTATPSDPPSGTPAEAAETPTDPPQQETTAPTAAAATTPAASATARRRGRPILGAIAGFFLGVFLWLDLVLFGVIGFESVAFWVFPPAGLALGIALAMWAPFGKTQTLN